MTISIIAVLLVLFSLGLVIPQKSLYVSKTHFDQWNAEHPVLSWVINSLRLNEIYVAPVTILFLGLFFLNLLVVLMHRVPIVLRRSYLIDRESSLAGMASVKSDPHAHTVKIPDLPQGEQEKFVAQAASFFRKRVWSVIISDDVRSFIAVRNRFSSFGFLLFHASFLFCLIGGLLIMYTRFSGNLLLTEGEEFYSDLAQFRVIKRDPKILHALPELGIQLIRVSPSYYGAVGTDLDVYLRIKYYSEIVDAVARVNHPVRKGAVSILPEGIGVSPLFVLRDRGGNEVQGGYFSLNVLKGDEDSFAFPGFPYISYVRFYPDFAEDEGKPMTRSLEIRNPVFHLRVARDGHVLFDGYRKPGEWASVDSFEIGCRDIRYWVDFLVIREYGDIALYIGFVLGAVGLIMRLVFFQKTIRVHSEYRNGGCVFFIVGRSEYYQYTFKEDLARMVAELTEYLNGLARGMRGGIAA